MPSPTRSTPHSPLDSTVPTHRKHSTDTTKIQGRPDVVIDLSSKGALDSLKSKPFTIKEGATFRMKACFKVQHQILSGLKYVQVVKRMGVSNKMQEMIGSYSPNTTDKREYEKKCEFCPPSSQFSCTCTLC